MARPMYASVLPTIKCSDCGEDLEISMMGEHVCGAQPGAPDIHTPTNHDRIAKAPPPLPLLAPTTFERPSSRSRKSPAPPPSDRPKSPASATGLVRSSTVDGHSNGPAPHTQAVADLKRPPIPVRSLTAPVEDSRQPEASGFPTLAIPRKAAPTHLTIGAPSTGLHSAPMSPMSPSFRGANVLKRMDTMTRGPFGSRARREPPKIQARPGSNEKSMAVPSAVDAMARPASATPARPPRPHSNMSLVETLHGTTLGRPDDPVSLDRPGLTVSPPCSAGDGADVLPGAREPEREVREKPRPDLVPTAKEEEIKPLPDLTTLHSNSQRQPHHTSVSSESSISSRSGFDSRTESSRSSHSSPFSLNSPMDFHRKTMSIDQESVHSATSRGSTATKHQLSESISDAASTDRESSHSIPSRPSTSTKHQPGESDASASRVDRESIHSIPSRASTAPSHQHSESDSKEAAFGEPSPLALSTAPPSLPIFPLRPVVSPSPGASSPLSPASLPMRSVISPSPGATTPLSPASPLSTPRERHQDLKPQPVQRSKGTCRGCSKPIFGKSIKAADGRITGRYHRECFVCHTCKTAFDTADFYVLNNNPYCAHHYHVLNHSLCHCCNKGIEGEYLETGPQKRYHVACFACHDCKRPLTIDYYELNSRYYCESDAIRVYEKSQLLTPGKRFPERRMTRFMQM